MVWERKPMVFRSFLPKHSDIEVSGIYEHLTLESPANFRDYRIRYHSRSRAFTGNERNSNNKSWKKNAETTIKNLRAVQIVGMDQMEQRSVVLFLRLKGLSKTAIHIHDELVAVLQENAVSHSSATI
jgi:carbamoylphosphate synthase small subunit